MRLKFSRGSTSSQTKRTRQRSRSYLNGTQSQTTTHKTSPPKQPLRTLKTHKLPHPKAIYSSNHSITRQPVMTAWWSQGEEKLDAAAATFTSYQTSTSLPSAKLVTAYKKLRIVDRLEGKQGASFLPNYSRGLLQHENIGCRKNFIFPLSTRAVGMGINLTEENTIVIQDRNSALIWICRQRTRQTGQARIVQSLRTRQRKDHIAQILKIKWHSMMILIFGATPSQRLLTEDRQYCPAETTAQVECEASLDLFNVCTSMDNIHQHPRPPPEGRRETQKRSGSPLPPPFVVQQPPNDLMRREKGKAAPLELEKKVALTDHHFQLLQKDDDESNNKGMEDYPLPTHLEKQREKWRSTTGTTTKRSLRNTQSPSKQSKHNHRSPSRGQLKYQNKSASWVERSGGQTKLGWKGCRD